MYLHVCVSHSLSKKTVLPHTTFFHREKERGRGEGEGEDGEWMRSTYNLKNSVTTRNIKAASLSPPARYQGEGEEEDREWMRSTT